MVDIKSIIKKPLRKIFDYYISTKSRRGAEYYKKVITEHYNLAQIKEQLKKLDYKRHPDEIKILKVYKNYNWEDDNLLPALKIFGQVSEYAIQHINFYSLYWQFFKKPSFNKKFVLDVQKLAADGQINMIFCLASGLIFTPRTFKEINKLGIVILNFAFDDHLKFVGYPTPTGWSGSRSLCKYMTLIATTYEESCEWYSYEGCRSVYLPESGNDKIHRPLHLNKDIDVCFVGRNYGKREALVNFLRENGIKIQTFGIGWDNGPVSVDKMVEIYSRSKIIIGINDSWGGGRFFAAQRDFEAVLCGSLYVTNKNDKIEACFEENKELVLYKNENDLVAKIKYYLTHEEERESIAKRGRERALREHTWEKRFEYVFRLLELV